MYREEVARVTGIIGEALGIVRFAVKDEAAREHLQAILGEAMDILYRPSSEAPGDLREYWRTKKAKQRTAKKDSGGGSGNVRELSGTVREMSEIAVVVEEVEEVEAEEEVVVPPVFVSMDDVDAVLTGWNALTGSSMRTGPTRSKRSAEQLRSLLVRLAKEEGDDVEAARRRIGDVVKWLWNDRAGTDLAKYVVPSTVCRKWDSYAEQITVPDNGTAGADWNARA